MSKYIVIFFFLVLITSGNTSNKEKIIENLKNTQNLDFNFEQNINGKLKMEIVLFNIQKKYFVNTLKAITKF